MDASLSRADLQAHKAQALRIAMKLKRAIATLRGGKLLPARPSLFYQVAMNAIVRAEKAGRIRPRLGDGINLLREAVVLYAADYTCCYCGRRA
jgi:hypothetical protein